MTERGMHETIAGLLEARRGERHVIVLQDYPDPDAISCAFAHQAVSDQYGIETVILHGGQVSHEQNVALVRLLGIELQRFEVGMDLGQFDGAVFFDNQGTAAEELTSALEQAGVPALLVVDHHEMQDRLQAEVSDIRRVGATASIYADYLRAGLLEIDPTNELHVRIATALMHGLLSDTTRFVYAGPEDFRAAAFLSENRDADLLQQIMSQSRSRKTMEVIERALGNRLLVESYSIAGVGYLRSEDRDAIPQAADFLLTEENIHTAIVYGIIAENDERESLVGSIRTSKITLDPDQFIKDVFGQTNEGRYFGGGKYSAGAFEIPVGFLSGLAGDEVQSKKWEVFDSQVKQKLFDRIGIEPAA